MRLQVFQLWELLPLSCNCHASAPYLFLPTSLWSLSWVQVATWLGTIWIDLAIWTEFLCPPPSFLSSLSFSPN
jgi:hypothetical protein